MLKESKGRRSFLKKSIKKLLFISPGGSTAGGKQAVTRHARACGP
jgi:hypothetical protein